MIRPSSQCTIRHPRFIRLVAGLCFFAVGYAVGDAAGAYTLSRGRQVLLDRGLQVQATTYPYTGLTSLDPGFNFDLWNSANFTTINLSTWPCPEVLPPLQSGTQFARVYGIFKTSSGEIVSDPETKYLTTAELPYVGKLVGYQYGDELDAQILDRLDDVKKTYGEWRSRYGNVVAYTDFSSGITSSQAITYMNATQPDMLMFNCYPGYYESEFNTVWPSRKNWYGTMQQWRGLALAGFTVDGVNSGPLPYAQYMNLHRYSYDAPLPDESFIRLQENASWAFGFTYIDGYMYKSVSLTGSAGDVPAVMFSTPDDISPTVVFNYVAEANRQSRNLGPALIRLVSTDIRMIGGTEHDSRPSNIAAYAPGAGGDPYMTNIRPYMPYGAPDPDYSDILIGYFEPLLADNPNCTFVDGLHFMIVNGATGDTPAALAQTYLLTFDFGDSGYDSLVRLDRDTGQVVPVELEHTGGSFYRCLYSLEGGTGDLFGYWNSSTPLPTIPEPGTLVLLATGLLALLCYAWRKRKWG